MGDNSNLHVDASSETAFILRPGQVVRVSNIEQQHPNSWRGAGLAGGESSPALMCSANTITSGSPAQTSRTQPASGIAIDSFFQAGLCLQGKELRFRIRTGDVINVQAARKNSEGFRASAAYVNAPVYALSRHIPQIPCYLKCKFGIKLNF